MKLGARIWISESDRRRRDRLRSGSRTLSRCDIASALPVADVGLMRTTTLKERATMMSQRRAVSFSYSDRRVGEVGWKRAGNLYQG